MRRSLPLLFMFSISVLVSTCGEPQSGSPATGGELGELAARPTATPFSAESPTLMTVVPELIPTQERVSADPPSSCPVTRPPDPPFVPPWGADTPTDAPGYPVASTFWYGTESLWTRLQGDGVWRSLPYDDGHYTQKIAWRPTSGEFLKVTGRRLDAPAPPAVGFDGNVSHREREGTFWMSGVNLPAPGCWEITGHTADAELSFVVWVASNPPS